MKVQAINNFNYIFPQKTKNVSQPMTRDTFTKSPAFRGYRLMPYLEGKVPYDAKNLKQFNQILSNMDNGYPEELRKFMQILYQSLFLKLNLQKKINLMFWHS